MEDLITLMNQAGFTQLIPMVDEVTDAYANKWGFGLAIKEYIQSGLLIGRK